MEYTKLRPRQCRQSGLGERTWNADAVRRYRANTGPAVQSTLQAMERLKSIFVQDLLSKLNLIACPKYHRQELEDEIQTRLAVACKSTSAAFRRFACDFSSLQNSSWVGKFWVRRQKVLEALVWLKQNNIYYHDIYIDLTGFNALASGDKDLFGLLRHTDVHTQHVADPSICIGI